MNAEQYEKVGQLFHAALELPREGRSAFLSGACGGDEELRQEVESLLAAHEQAGDFVADAGDGRCRRSGSRGRRTRHASADASAPTRCCR